LEKNTLQATLGFRTHSGWAAIVVIADKPECPTVLNRHRIELADPKILGSKQPYHFAENMSLSDAENFIERCRESTFELAETAFATALRDLKDRDAVATGCGLVIGSGRKVTDLGTILASHALIHTAEGDFYRDAITYAAERYGLLITAVPEKEAHQRAAAVLGMSADQFLATISALGKLIGSPWTQDEKLATAVALVSARQSRRDVKFARRAAS
jgi:hypothetical protein